MYTCIQSTYMPDADDIDYKYQDTDEYSVEIAGFIIT